MRLKNKNKISKRISNTQNENVTYLSLKRTNGFPESPKLTIFLSPKTNNWTIDKKFFFVKKKAHIINFHLESRKLSNPSTKYI